MLTYASEIWGTVRLDNIEKVNMMACKYFLGVSKHSHDFIGKCSFLEKQNKYVSIDNVCF